MKLRIITIVSFIASVLIAGAMTWLLRSSPQAVALQRSPLPSPVAQATTGRMFPRIASRTPLPLDKRPGEYPQLSLKTMSRDAATKIYVQRLMQDPGADWKIPVDFYGRVIDENSQPMPGALAHLILTTPSVPGGTAETWLPTDNNGLFSFTRQHGKLLEVRVQKDGYYSIERSGAYVAFEYANPSSTDYYEPAANDPVVFHLRKKGMNAAQLLHWHRFVALNAQNQKALDLKTGQTTQGQSPSLLIEVTEDNNTPGSFAWSARISVVGGVGGVQFETDRFPFLAPASGYQQSVIVDLTTPKPPDWNEGQGGAFYVQTPSGYGRYTIGMGIGAKSMEAEGYFNPTPGDQKLEPASGQK